jgi:hypothetical protein
MRTAATVSVRIGAGASFHGGGLVTDKPNSPHLLAPRIKAKMYFGIAANDDKNQPDAKVKLKEAFEAAHNPAEIEVYSESLHGWCVPDMLASQNGMPIYISPMPSAPGGSSRLCTRACLPVCDDFSAIAHSILSSRVSHRRFLLMRLRQLQPHFSPCLPRDSGTVPAHSVPSFPDIHIKTTNERNRHETR